MEESINDSVADIGDKNVLPELNSTSPSTSIQRGCTENKDDSSDDEAGLAQRHRRRIQFSDSDTEKENVQTRASDDNDSVPEKSDSEIETNNRPYKSLASKSRILMNSSGSDSEDNISTSVLTLKNEEQQMRMKNKRSKMQQKFKGLLNSRSKHTEVQNLSDNPSSGGEKSEISDEASDIDMSSIANIKQKIKKSMAAIPSICDPDTSDEESNIGKNKHPKQGKKKVQRSTKMIDAKPMRMSAKQAMENMQLIKSESNRMLREKAVSLPYHRPKALSLKDIMSRRKPAVTSDGKALPIKMNEEQLKQYALQLEQRQKEMMELCKSESDEDLSEPELEEKTENVVPNNSTNKELEEKIENVVPSIKKLEEKTENVDPSINKDLETIEEPSTVEKTINDIHTNMEINTNDEINIVQTDSVEGTSIEEYVSDTVNNERQSEKRNDSMNSETNQNDSNTDLRLVYNDDSVEEENVKLDDTEHPIDEDKVIDKTSEQVEAHKTRAEEIICSEQESQLISLHYTENGTDKLKEMDIESEMKDDDLENEVKGSSEEIENFEDGKQDDFFSDDDVNMDDIDKMIENAEIMKDNDEYTSSPMLIKDPLTIKPKLEGAPGMVIDLFGTDVMPKRSGIELLKERFTYFSKLKTPEEKERDRERKTNPGSLHLKLKHELEEKIAEQRSLEWAKRLQEEKQLHQEKDAILDDADEADDNIEKMEAKLDEENDIDNSKSESESDEELVENDIEIKDKPRKHNPMVDDEAEESDIDEDDKKTGQQKAETNEDMEEGDDNIEDDDSEDAESSSDDESSEDEEQTTKPKKGRILKAFEDSDDEDDVTKLDNLESASKDTIEHDKLETVKKNDHETENTAVEANSSDIQNSSQDDVIQLAQRHKSSVSEDLFASQESSTLSNVNKDLIPEASDDPLGTQTFSIASAKPSEFLYPSQPYHDPNLNGVINNLSQNVLGSQLLTTQCSQSQPIGEDILALCTGQFYDNEFVPTCDVNKPTEPAVSQDPYIYDSLSDPHPKSDTVTPIVEDNLDLSNDKIEENGTKPEEHSSKIEENSSKTEENNSKIEENSSKLSDEKSAKVNEDRDVLKSILDELDEPELDQPKPNRFFTGAPQNKNPIAESTHVKKRLIIDSDDENNEGDMIAGESKKKKKLKKRKLEKRALQISDDEDEEEDGSGLEEADYGSEVEEDGDIEVEYDSEENEIEIKPDKPKKKRPANAFFEQEAELTSEDEWVGSGDEDEHGLDRMEREEGDDDVFHQGKLRKELGQIHMRDVLDQDKREVRLLQELLFEDGDLGGGHRQRKFRWRNAGDEETGTVPDDLTDTQEEEFESEEQWRKQRHEREVFLRQMQNQGEEENVNVTVNRTTIIKANLCSKSMSTLLMEVNQSKTETKDSPVVPEKKTIKEIPSPKKSFSILQQKYHSSVLNRGSTALARLAALATPLATADEDTPKIAALDSRKRNFVFAALTPDEDKPKVTIKRKAIANIGTPNLVKKIRLEEKQDHRKSSLLDHLNT